MADRPRVLVAEDSPAMRQLIAIASRAAGAEVVEAADGLAALKLITAGRFALIFVDINMPVMDGLKLIQRVRDDPSHAGTKICVVTTEEAAATEQHARSLGADEYLQKPVSRKAVDGVLRAALAPK